MVLDSMLQRMKAGKETLNVYEFICQLRLKRPLMVQTEIQYAFIHDALEEFITCGDTSIAVTNLWIVINKLRKVTEGKSGFLQQFELLEMVSQMPTEVNCNEAIEEFNASKNRYPDRLPYNLTRVRLRPTGVKGADYINASFVDVSTKMSFSVTVLHLLHNSNGLIQQDCFDLLSDFPPTCRATSTGGHTSLHKVHWSPP